MMNPFITKEVIQGVVLELGAIVTLDHQYLDHIDVELHW
jgi:hypothetical protein